MLDALGPQAELQAGKGRSRRDAESGQLLIDRGRHLDALEAAFWVNSWADRLYHKHLHGDKDTFALGFALMGKAHMYRQVGRWSVCMLVPNDIVTARAPQEKH